MTSAIHTESLGKRYGSFWALQECSIDIPHGRVSGLIGPNGAGKSTLLQLITGLANSSSGDVTVFGMQPAQNHEFLSTIGYLAQEIPLFRRMSAEDHIEMGQHLNKKWDSSYARQRIKKLEIPLNRATGKLSGGQRAQVALALTLAKRPQLLLLDEPVAALDPLARRDFLAALAEAVAEGDLTVVMSSHLLLDLERICDHLVLLASSRTQLCGEIETVLSEHKLLIGPLDGAATIEKRHNVIYSTKTSKQATLLIRTEEPIADPSWQIAEPNLEDVVLAYMGQNTSKSALSATTGDLS